MAQRRPKIRRYTSLNENFEYGYLNSNALLQFVLKFEGCKQNKTAIHPTKCDADSIKTRYSKCSKILNTFSLFSNKMLVFRAGIPKVHVRIANREDPDQTASSAV